MFSTRGGEVVIYFTVRWISFLGLQLPDLIFVKIGSMAGSIFVILIPNGRFRPFKPCECDSNRLGCNIPTF